MDVAEGFLYLVILIDLFMILVGGGVLAASAVLLRRIGHWQVRLGILVLGMALNFAYSARMDINWVFTSALYLGVPMAVLVPVFGFPSGTVPGIRQLFAAYVPVAVLTAALPFAFIISGLSMVPFIYWHTPLSNGLLYNGLLIGVVGIAVLVYRVTGLGSSESRNREHASR
jgi:hypothetical protein